MSSKLTRLGFQKVVLEDEVAYRADGACPQVYVMDLPYINIRIEIFPILSNKATLSTMNRNVIRRFNWRDNFNDITDLINLNDCVSGIHHRVKKIIEKK